MTVDKFPHTERGIRRTSYPLVPCGDGCFAAAGKLEHNIRYINISLDVFQPQYVELPVEQQTGVKHSRGGNAAYGEIKA